MTEPKPTYRVTKPTDYRPDSRNANLGTERGAWMLEQSIREDGAARSIVVDADGVVVAGNKTLQAAIDAGLVEAVEVEVEGEQLVVVRRRDWRLGGDDGGAARRYAYRDNRSSEIGLNWNVEQILVDLDEGFDLSGMWQPDELNALLAELNPPEPPADLGAQIDKAGELQEKWQVKAGDVWEADGHFIICGDCRETKTWDVLLKTAGVDKVNGMFTSPPYAEQRKLQYGGVPTAEYVDWWEAVQANVREHLAEDGSFFVNIKPHCEDGQRVLYVFDLVPAMVRRWGWRFVDELCWVTKSAPGEWPNRFKNWFEPIYHFSPVVQCKFRPRQVVQEFTSDPNKLEKYGGTNSKWKSRAGSSFGGHGMKSKTFNGALPSNVLDMPNRDIESATAHAGVFSIALPTFFIKAYSDPSDVWCDPFLGSGTTVVAAAQNQRRGLGIEVLEKYVAVCLERLANMGLTPHLAE